MKLIALVVCLFAVAPAFGERGRIINKIFGGGKKVQYSNTQQNYAAQGTYSQSSSGDSAQLLSLINNYRAQNGLGALSYDPSLNISDSGSHRNFKRSGVAGVSNWASSQNAQQTFEMWRNSPGHNANMLSPNITRAGFGYGNGTAFTGSR
jgi:uncharacterized protein YkwD